MGAYLALGDSATELFVAGLAIVLCLLAVGQRADGSCGDGQRPTSSSPEGVLAGMTAMLDALGSPAVLLDEGGRILNFNRAWRQVPPGNPLVPTESDVGDDYRRVLAEANQQQAVTLLADEAFGDASLGETPLATEFDDLLAGRRERLELTYAYHFDDHCAAFDLRVARFVCEERACVLVTHDDVTMRKRVEYALSESERRYRSLIEHAPDPIVVATTERILFANAAYAAMLGLEGPEQAVGRSPFDFIASEHHELVRVRIERMFETGAPAPRVREKMRRVDGGQVDVEVSSSPCSYAGRKAVQVILRDVSEQVQAEASLRESESRFRQLAEALEDVVWLRDGGANRVLYVNGAYQRIWGRSREAIYLNADDWLEAIHPEDRRRVEQAEAKLRTGEFHEQYRLVRPDGSIAWIRDRAWPITDEQGRVVRIAGLAEDMTARMRAAEAMAAGEARMRAILDSAVDGIATITEQGVIESVNPALERLFGCGRRELIGLPITRVLDAPARGNAEAGAAGVAGGGVVSLIDRFLQAARQQKSSFELRGTRADGTRFPVSLSAGEVRVSGRRLLTLIVRDVTDQVRAERALRESEQRFRRLADAAPVMIWIAGADGGCTYFNRGWLAFRGRSLAEEAGSGWMQGVHPDDHDRVRDHYTVAFTRQQSFRVEYRLRRHDGTYRWIYAIGVPRHENADEGFSGFIGSCIDITDRKRDERRLKLLVDELDHRVKNTLATVLALAQKQFATATSLEELQESFSGRLRAMSHTHEALARTRWDGVDLAEMASAVLGPYRHDRPGRITCEGPSVQLPPRAALPVSLSLHELGMNAFKHGALSAAEGRLSVGWERTEEGVRITWREAGGPRVSPPAAERESGMGVELIEGLVHYELQGRTEFDFDPGGLHCIIHVPLAREADQGMSMS